MPLDLCGDFFMIHTIHGKFLVEGVMIDQWWSQEFMLGGGTRLKDKIGNKKLI